MTTITTRKTTHRAAVNGLAVVGFVALVIIGMALAVYAARYVPKLASKAGSAAVYLSSQIAEGIFNRGAEDGGLVVVPPADETVVPFPGGEATSTPATTTPSTGTGATPTPSAGTPTGGAYPLPGSSTGGSQIPDTALYGKADLAVSSIAAGYCTSTSPDSFVKSSSVPSGKRGGISFSTINQGTNVSGAWKFEAELPTSPSYTFTSPSQESLRPGERLDSKFCFDRPKEGDDRELTIRLDSRDDVNESNESNNDSTVELDIK